MLRWVVVLPCAAYLCRAAAALASNYEALPGGVSRSILQKLFEVVHGR